MKIRPKDVGLPFKEVPFISVGSCINKYNPRILWAGSLTASAHTHICPNDPYRHCICFRNERLYRSKLCMWHEYAHVLTPIPYEAIDCAEDHESEQIRFPDEKTKKEWDGGHNPIWTEIMNSFNLKPAKAYSWSDLNDTW